MRPRFTRRWWSRSLMSGQFCSAKLSIPTHCTIPRARSIGGRIAARGWWKSDTLIHLRKLRKLFWLLPKKPASVSAASILPLMTRAAGGSWKSMRKASSSGWMNSITRSTSNRSFLLSLHQPRAPRGRSLKNGNRNSHLGRTSARLQKKTSYRRNIPPDQYRFFLWNLEFAEPKSERWLRIRLEAADKLRGLQQGFSGFWNKANKDLPHMWKTRINAQRAVDAAG